MDLKSKQQLFLKAFEITNGNITKACQMTGIARQTHYNWLESEDYAVQVAQVEFEAQERRIDLAVEKLDDRLNSGSGPDIRFVLKTLGAKRGYGAKQTITVNPGEGFKDYAWPEETDDLDSWADMRDKALKSEPAPQPEPGLDE